MKKLISLISAVAIISSMCSLTAFAANTRTVTLSATVEEANIGDEFETTLTLDTSNTVKTIGVKLAFDPNDIELGLSTSAKDVNLDDYADFIGTPDFPTEESVYEALIGHKSYVTDDYYNTYAGYAANKNLGSATIDYEEKDGLGKVAFAYAISTAKNALTKTDNMVIGGVVLKVKTAEKKQTTIKIVEAANSDGTDTSYNTIVNEVVINLNGYTGEPEGTSTKVEHDGETYALSNNTFDFDNTLDPTSKWNVVVTYDGSETKTYGWSWKNFGIDGEGTVKGKIKFGVKISDTSKYDATLFTFDLDEVTE